MLSIDDFLSKLRETSDWIEVIMSSGSCYKLSKLLQSIYGGDIYIVFLKDKPMHSVLKYKGVFYDIFGKYNPAKRNVLIMETDLYEEELDSVKSWSFDNSKTIAGKCTYCGEIGVVNNHK